MKTNPTPRAANFYGMRSTAHVNVDGSWLEPEELCYPNGGMTRRAFVAFPDGKMRVTICGLPDTYFSIPARIQIKKTTIHGYVTGTKDSNGNSSLEFRVYDSSAAAFTEVSK